MLPSVQVATEGYWKQLIQVGDKGVRKVRNLGVVEGIEILVAEGSCWSLKMGTRFAVVYGDKDGGRKGQRTQIPKEAACLPLCCTWNNACL